MVSPSTISPITIITGTSNNDLIDAMFIPQGQTIVKWGGERGTGAELSFSFIGPSSTFPANYPTRYAGEKVVIPDYVKHAFRTAFDAWSDVANISFSELEETSTEVGDLRIGALLSNPFFYSGPGGSILEAQPPGRHSLNAGDIYFSHSYLTQDLTQPIDVEFLPGKSAFMHAMHEIGHAVLSLHDVTTNAGWNGKILPAELNYRTQTIMSYSATPNAAAGLPGRLSYAATTPMILDVLAAQWLYGANTGKGASNDTYSFSQSQTYHETIWDAGGTDTIIVADATDGINIDLRPGSLSDVGSKVTTFSQFGSQILTQTVGIAYGAIIENAVGGTGNDLLTGNSADNILNGGAGNDNLNGGDGIDMADYSGVRSTYTITNASGRRTITDSMANRDGTDTLTNIERLQFSDGVLAFDNARTDDAGRGYLIYRAAFDRAPDAEGLGYWIRALERGQDYGAVVAASFIASPEFIATYGTNLSNATFLNLVYQNVLDRTPDQGGSDYWLGQLNNGYARSNLLASFAISDENYNAVSPSIADGIWFV